MKINYVTALEDRTLVSEDGETWDMIDDYGVVFRTEADANESGALVVENQAKRIEQLEGELRTVSTWALDNVPDGAAPLVGALAGELQKELTNLKSTLERERGTIKILEGDLARERERYFTLKERFAYSDNKLGAVSEELRRAESKIAELARDHGDLEASLANEKQRADVLEAAIRDAATHHANGDAATAGQVLRRVIAEWCRG